MANFGNQDRVDNGLEATEVGVGDPSTEERADVDPEGVEGGQTEGDLLAHVEGTGLSLSIAGVGSSTSGGGERPGDVVGVHGDGTVVTHTLNQFDKGNLEAVSVNLSRAMQMAIAYSEDLPWNPGRDTGQRSKLLLSGKVVAISQVRVLESSLALGMKEGGGSNSVKLGVLARGVA